MPEAGTPPALDLVEAATLYQTLYWIARTAAAPTPETDVLHVTAAGWSAIPALVHRALHRTPMVLTEHGVYLREAYLAAIRSGDAPGSRFAATRLARGLTRMAYSGADVVCPVTDANAYWEMGLGMDAGKILILYNGLQPPAAPSPPPGTRTIVSVGRIDPLKDIHTMLRVAAETARASCPTPASCTTARRRRARRRTAAPARRCTSSSGSATASASWVVRRIPTGSVRDADVVLMTSISEGLPMSILEAMSQGRPVVSTGVGGVPDVVKGCGVVTAAGRRPRARDGGRRRSCAIPSSPGGSGSGATAGSGGSSTRPRASSGYRELLGAIAAEAGGVTARARRPGGRTAARGGAARPRAAGHARGGGRARGLGAASRLSARSTWRVR